MKEFLRTLNRSLVLSALAAAAMLSVSAPASAESQLVNGTGSATARLDFEVVIPRVLFLGVGTGSALPAATNATIDKLVYDYTSNPSGVGTGVASAGQSVKVSVRGNNGQVTLAASTTAPLTSAAGATIPWTQIAATSDLTELPSPDIGTSATVNVTGNGGKVTERYGVWTFSYANANLVAPGTYDGRVTYTAAMP